MTHARGRALRPIRRLRFIGPQPPTSTGIDSETFSAPGTPICQNTCIVLKKGNLDMHRHSTRFIWILLASLVAVTACNAKASPAAAVPAPAIDASRASTAGRQTAVISGGCFWGIQAVFQHVKGVISATSGYSGGSSKTAEYEIVSTGETGHAESVQIVYDPSQITYGELLRVFFSVAHDPTQLNRQGPDAGT